MYRAVVVTVVLVVAAAFSTLDLPPGLRSQWQPGDPIVDARDGQQYRTVVIGEQVWMAENLNVGTLVASSAAGSLMSDNGVVEKYCWQDNQQACDGTGGEEKRGGFYEWEEAVQHWKGQPSQPVRGVCPADWHLPSYQEWDELRDLLGGSTAYKELIVGGGSGFDALLTGYRCTMNGSFRPSAMAADYRAYFWTANQTDASNAPILEFGATSQQDFSFLKSVGLSVRCVWDGDMAATPAATPTDGATATADAVATSTATTSPTAQKPTETATATAEASATDAPGYTVLLPLLKNR